MSMITGPLKYLRRPFTSNVEEGDKVVIVTDTRQDARVWQAIMSIVEDIGAEPTLAMFEPRPADYYDPPSVVASAMMTADVNVLVASTSMLHSPASMAAMASGIPTICLDGQVTLEMFQYGAATADYHEIATMKHYAAKNVFGEGAKTARVTSDFGTDLEYSVENRIFVPPLRGQDWDPFKAYRRTEEGREGSPMYACLFPGGEFNVPPVEGTANGVYAADLTMHHLGKIDEPILLTIENGRIVDIKGHRDAKRFRDHLRDFGDESAYEFPTEASIGLNKKAQIVGSQREDKNIYGAVHFGLGTNSDVGGTVESNLHMDLVVLQPTLYVDGVKKMDHGEFLVPLDRDLPADETSSPKVEAGV
ncbi:aminopeptidase [Nocardiopsis sp. ATB16-24]|uniref:aminopeptidase n=1 Tax=Nocardiopsis sp. ATB16-24 TaxID=3019555 RepID=UPI0025525D06|nr:aminopeptidase [Nocardiopsis sp. ATB16-24]